METVDIVMPPAEGVTGLGLKFTATPAGTSLAAKFTGELNTPID